MADGGMRQKTSQHGQGPHIKALAPQCGAVHALPVTAGKDCRGTRSQHIGDHAGGIAQMTMKEFTERDKRPQYFNFFLECCDMISFCLTMKARDV